jgi:hypothetical protein
VPSDEGWINIKSRVTRDGRLIPRVALKPSCDKTTRRGSRGSRVDRVMSTTRGVALEMGRAEEVVIDGEIS